MFLTRVWATYKQTKFRLLRKHHVWTREHDLLKHTCTHTRARTIRVLELDIAFQNSLTRLKFSDISTSSQSARARASRHIASIVDAAGAFALDTPA